MMGRNWLALFALMMIIVLAGCTDDVRERPLSQDILENEDTRSLLEAQLDPDERALLERYLERVRAEGGARPAEGVTVGDAILSQRMHEQEAQMRALEDPRLQDREEALERLRAVVSIRALAKDHSEGRDALTLEIVNHSGTPVSSVKGLLRPRKKVGYWFPAIEILHDQRLEPGQRHGAEKVLEYDTVESITLRNTAFDELTFHWIPERLTLADGSTLEVPPGK